MTTDANRAIQDVGKILKPLGFRRQRLLRGYHEWQIDARDITWGVCTYLSGPRLDRTLSLDLTGYALSTGGPVPVSHLSEQSVVSRKAWGDHVRMMSFFGKGKTEEPSVLSRKQTYIADFLRASFLPVIAEINDSLALQRALWEGWLTFSRQGVNVVAAFGDDQLPLWRRELPPADLKALKRIRGAKTHYYTRLTETLAPRFVAAGFDPVLQGYEVNRQLWVLEHPDLTWTVQLGGCNENSTFDAEAYLAVNGWVRNPSTGAWRSMTAVNLESVCDVPNVDFKQLFNYRNDLFDYRNDPSDPGNESWNRSKMIKIADLVETKLIPWLKAERDFKKLKAEQLHYIEKL